MTQLKEQNDIEMQALVELIKENRKQARILDAYLSSLLEGNLPVGREICYEKNGFPQQGVILDHGYEARIKVRNTRTNSEYWIDWYDLVNYYED